MYGHEMCWPAKQQTVFLTSRSTAAGQGIQHVRVRVRTSGSYRVVRDYTSSTALMHPSFSGLFVTCAYLPHTTCSGSGSGVGVGVGLGLGLALGLEFGLV